MQRFSSIDLLFEAFENITLQADSEKNTFTSTKLKFENNRKEASNSQLKCYNCNQEGHFVSSCLKPKREKGSCSYCGKMDHQLKDCSAAKKESKQGSSNVSNTSSKATNNMTALVEEPANHRDVEDTDLACGKTGDCQLKEPLELLTKPTREYCVLLNKESENEYYLEALIDSGSTINIMSESTYLNFFNDEKLVQNKVETNYGGINKSPLCILGTIISKVRLHLIPDHIFSIKFVIVPDSTMTYDVLLGREFISTPGLTVMFDQSLKIKFNESLDNILNIEAIEQASPLDIFSDNLDARLSLKKKKSLIN